MFVKQDILDIPCKICMTFLWDLNKLIGVIRNQMLHHMNGKLQRILMCILLKSDYTQGFLTFAFYVVKHIYGCIV